MKTAIWWIRRDLRLDDNPALHTAQSNTQQVLPVFIIDPAILKSENSSDNRVAFLYRNLRILDETLAARGSRLVVRRGEPQEELARLMAETQAQAIYAQTDYTPYSNRRDSLVSSELPLRLVNSVTIHPPDMVLKSDGSPYTVYTPFSKAWKALPPPSRSELLPIPAWIQTPQDDFPSLPIPFTPALPAGVNFAPGEEAAQIQLANFTKSASIYRYSQDRDLPGVNSTSGLSPYLRFGILSARRAAVSAYEAIHNAANPATQKAAHVWLNQLIWREFFISISYHFPFVYKRSFRPALQHIPWENDNNAFQAWKRGETGYPIVDAAMRELVATGWMHNRARMISASFLVKHLLIDWRWGERWFMNNLLDGDPAVNNGSWQWIAGTGTDAAPYFRIFNPILQGKKFDPSGDYVRKWIPELARLPKKYIHTPWQMPRETQIQAHCVIGKDYPAPIVEHHWARQRALEVYKHAKGQPINNP